MDIDFRRNAYISSTAFSSDAGDKQGNDKMVLSRLVITRHDIAPE